MHQERQLFGLILVNTSLINHVVNGRTVSEGYHQDVPAALWRTCPECSDLVVLVQ
jgi:hypothetical protein